MTADRGHSLSCRVTATNVVFPEGSPVHVSASSWNSIKVPGSPPEPPLSGPILTGEAAVGATLMCSAGTWTGAPEPTFTFQWLLGGVPIPGATKATFMIGSADRGFDVTCEVRGTNSEGTASARKSVHVPGIAPVPEELPFISGSASVGQPLTCERGIWSGKPPPSFTYQWFRDGTAIASATESVYTVEPADQGHLLSCDVTASNSEGSVEEESTNGVVIPTHVVQAKGETLGFTSSTTQPPQPSAAVIVASIKRQLTTALEGAHIKKVLKAGSFSFSFLPPWEGKLEVLWYEFAKAAHGVKKLVLAQSSNSFTITKKGTVKLKLTSKGRQVLKGKKHMTLKAEAIFTIPHEKPVSWSETLGLKT